ncbi:MAG TPA: LamG-like jellyroll fold domain-containing protein [Thermoguttaceae bacterium]|nr:LamG-like jellyroll fold domain-containing protein [Thermoguttaceae bacterium]
MRTRIFFIAAACFVLAAGWCLSAATTANAELVTDLVLYCDMEGAFTTTLPDVSTDANVYNGAIAGAVTQQTDAGRGKVLSFDTRNSGNSVNFGDVLDPGTTSYTVALWMYRDDLTAVEVPAGKGNASTSAEAWSLGLRNSGHASGPGLSVRANYTSDATNKQNTVTEGLTPAGRVEAQVWYHIAMVINQETGHFYGYINGVGSGENGDDGLWNCDEASYTVTFPNNGTADFNTTAALILGKYNTASGYYKGDLDDVAVWTRALSAAEIQTLYTETADGTRIPDIVPEPGMLVLLSGIGLFGLMRRRG